MREIKGDLWELGSTFPDPVFCITTNGSVKSNGDAVMGRGCAYEATKLYPGIQRTLGTLINKYGNVVQFIGMTNILAFPVKHVWWDKADPGLISLSAASLESIAVCERNTLFLLPRPGCGNGGLKWAEVRPLLEFLPDNVLVVSKPGDCI